MGSCAKRCALRRRNVEGKQQFVVALWIRIFLDIWGRFTVRFCVRKRASSTLPAIYLPRLRLASALRRLRSGSPYSSSPLAVSMQFLHRWKCRRIGVRCVPLSDDEIFL